MYQAEKTKMSSNLGSGSLLVIYLAACCLQLLFSCIYCQHNNNIIIAQSKHLTSIHDNVAMCCEVYMFGFVVNLFLFCGIISIEFISCILCKHDQISKLPY